MGACNRFAFLGNPLENPLENPLNVADGWP